MDERTFNKNFKLYPTGVSVSLLKKYLEPENAGTPRILKLLKFQGFATNKDDSVISMSNFCIWDSLINRNPKEDSTKLAVVEKAFSEQYPSHSKIKIHFAWREDDECAVWRADMFTNEEINQRLKMYFDNK